jgi:hypothetical protein
MHLCGRVRGPRARQQPKLGGQPPEGVVDGTDTRFARLGFAAAETRKDGNAVKEGPDSLHDRREWQSSVGQIDAPALQDDRARGTSALQCHRQDPGLSDAGLASDEHGSALAMCRLLQRSRD